MGPMKFAGALLLFVGFFASASFAGHGKHVRPGRWGGMDIAIEVHAFSTDIEFNCAHGSIAQPIMLDRHGQFDVLGTYVQEGPGPVAGDHPPPIRPARYTGEISGNTMRLTVILTDTGDTIGTFSLSRGERSFVVKCL